MPFDETTDSASQSGLLPTVNRRMPLAANNFFTQLAAEESGELPAEDNADTAESSPELVDDGEPVESAAADTELDETPDDSGQDAPPSLLDEAQRYGFTKEQAAAFGDALPQIYAALDRQAAQLIREQLSAEKPDLATATEPPAATPPPKPAAPPEPVAKVELGLKEDDFEPETFKTLKAIETFANQAQAKLAHQEEVIKALAQLAIDTHGKTSAMASESQSESSASFEREMDGLFASLGDEFKDVYGTSPMRQLAPGSEHVSNRNKLVEEMTLLERADKQAGRGKGSPKDYAQRALRVLHAEKVTSQARRQIQDQITKQRRKGIAMPSGRNGKPASKDQRALAVIKEKLDAMGLGTE